MQKNAGIEIAPSPTPGTSGAASASASPSPIVTPTSSATPSASPTPTASATPTSPGVAPTSCTPAPVPSPGAFLIAPAPGATGVSTSIGSIAFQLDNSVPNSVALASTGNATITTTQIAEQGTPSPTGANVYIATLPGPLASMTTYAVTVNNTTSPGGCPQTFNSPAGSFTTGT